MRVTSETEQRDCIGILGGIGPAATAHLHQLLITEAQREGAADDQDFPALIIWNVPFPGTDCQGWTQAVQERLCQDLCQATVKMGHAGATMLLPACNTIDIFTSEINTHSLVPLLSLPALSIACAAEQGISSLGVLTSRTSRHHRLHEPHLRKHGLRGLYPTDSEQRTLDRLILAAMSGNVGNDEKLALAQITEALLGRGVEAVLLGCTELSLIAPEGCLDSSQIGASSVLELFRKREGDTSCA